MDTLTVPYKIEFKVETYDGDWTSEEIAAGLAGEPRVDTQSAWYEPTPAGPVEVTDEKRIKELEDSIKV